MVKRFKHDNAKIMNDNGMNVKSRNPKEIDDVQLETIKSKLIPFNASLACQRLSNLARRTRLALNEIRTNLNGPVKRKVSENSFSKSDDDDRLNSFTDNNVEVIEETLIDATNDETLFEEEPNEKTSESRVSFCLDVDPIQNDSICELEETEIVEGVTVETLPIDEIEEKVDVHKRRFVDYINKSLKAYLKAVQRPLLPQYVFKGDFKKLESFCEMLEKEGIGRIVEQHVRVSTMKFQFAYLPLSSDRNSLEPDAFIPFPAARMYAFHEDLVKAFAFNSVADETKTGRLSIRSSISETGDDNAQKKRNLIRKAFVISILKKSGNRNIVGKLQLSKLITIKSKKFLVVLPYGNDNTTPYIYLPLAKTLKFFKKNSIKVSVGQDVHVETAVEYENEKGLSFGTIKKFIGFDGVLQHDLQAVLMKNNLGDIKHYDDKFQVDSNPLVITKKDLENRLDLREKCIFTIDPITAKDLDDAVSIQKITNGLYEVGVHISDVTHFLPENCELDNLVKKRATSVYLPTEVYEMLPSSLTQKCSLLPGEDKFAVSVFQKVYISGKLQGKPKIVRSVIHSCAKLAYEHAQFIIDNPNETRMPDDFPQLHGFDFKTIRLKVLLLDYVAKQMRKKRFQNGALTIDDSKIFIEFDAGSGKPINYTVEARQDANFLIEEYMLMANQIVAKFIFEKYPDTSILRKHDVPMGKMLLKIEEDLEKYGYNLNTSSSISLQKSISHNCSLAPNPDFLYSFICLKLRKSLSRAKYFCTQNASQAELRHYALSVPFYTHFTSPIRRYADIMVHRNLTAALGLTEPTQRDPETLHELAEICNVQKYRAKCAGEDALEVCYNHLVQSEKLRLVKSAVVCHLRADTMEVIDCETGHYLVLPLDNFRVIAPARNPYFIILTRRNFVKIIKLFSVVQIKVFVTASKKLSACLYVPKRKAVRKNNSSIFNMNRKKKFLGKIVKFPKIKYKKDKRDIKKDNIFRTDAKDTKDKWRKKDKPDKKGNWDKKDIWGTEDMWDKKYNWGKKDKADKNDNWFKKDNWDKKDNWFKKDNWSKKDKSDKKVHWAKKDKSDKKDNCTKKDKKDNWAKKDKADKKDNWGKNNTWRKKDKGDKKDNADKKDKGDKRKKNDKTEKKDIKKNQKQLEK